MKGGKPQVKFDYKIVGENPEADEDDGRKQCPYCRRKFNPDPYSRHIDICPRKREKERIKL